MKAFALVACALAAMNVHAQEPVRPYAAGSLRAALDEVARAFTEAKVEAVYGASGPGQDILAKHGFAPGDSK